MLLQSENEDLWEFILEKGRIYEILNRLDFIIFGKKSFIYLLSYNILEKACAFIIG